MHFRKRPGERFPAGEHGIRYIASDKRENAGECKFKIIVRGIVLGKVVFARINVVIVEYATNQNFTTYVNIQEGLKVKEKWKEGTTSLVR